MSCEISNVLDRYPGGCPGWHALFLWDVFQQYTVEYSFRVPTEWMTVWRKGQVLWEKLICTAIEELRDATAREKPKQYPGRLLPGPSQEPSAQRPNCTSPETGPSQGLPSNNQPACSCPSTASAPVSGHAAHHCGSLGAALWTFFRLRALLLRDGTHRRMHTKHSSGLHRTYRMTRGRTKGRERETVGWFGEGMSEKEGQV